MEKAVIYAGRELGNGENDERINFSDSLDLLQGRPDPKILNFVPSPKWVPRTRGLKGCSLCRRCNQAVGEQIYEGRRVVSRTLLQF